jgi:uncharacterized membrane protein YraQ (UPF0718 family)
VVLKEVSEVKGNCQGRQRKKEGISKLLIGYLRGGGQHIIGLRTAGNMTVQILPLLVCAFTVAGMAQVLIPHDIVAKWVGMESGIRGIIIGTIAGGFAPGGPYVSLPIASGLLRSGAAADGSRDHGLEIHPY